VRFDKKNEAEIAIEKLNGTTPIGFSEPLQVKFANNPASTSQKAMIQVRLYNNIKLEFILDGPSRIRFNAFNRVASCRINGRRADTTNSNTNCWRSDSSSTSSWAFQIFTDWGNCTRSSNSFHNNSSFSGFSYWRHSRR
jgi:hypothetical protein